MGLFLVLLDCKIWHENSVELSSVLLGFLAVLGRSFVTRCLAREGVVAWCLCTSVWPQRFAEQPCSGK